MSRTAKPLIALMLAPLVLMGGCQAIESADSSAAKPELDKKAIERVATAAQEGGEYATASRMYQQYLEKNPRDADMLASYGAATLAAGEIDKAAEIYARALELAPDRTDTRMGLGRIYLAKHEPAKALAEFQAVIGQDSKNVRALNGAGIALDLLGRNAEAQKLYRTALAIKPDDRAAQNNLGLSLALSGSYDAAIADLSKLTQEPGAIPRMRHNLALALGLKGDQAGAAKLLAGELDERAIAENRRFYMTVRSAPAAGGPAIAYFPARPDETREPPQR